MIKTNSNPVASVVIVSYNTSSLLKACIQSIVRYTSKVSYEIIVVDNASEDGSPNMIKENFRDIVLIENAINVGFAKANNQALAISKGNVAILLNSDTVLLDDAVSFLYNRIKADPFCAICGPRLLNSNGSIQQSIGRYPTMLSLMIAPIVEHFKLGVLRIGLNDINSIEMPRVINKYWITGACMAVNCTLLDKKNLLDEEFFFMLEDIDICKRTVSAGWNIWVDPTIKIMHLLGASRQKSKHSELEIKLKTSKLEQSLFYAKKHFNKFEYLILKIGLSVMYIINYVIAKGVCCFDRKIIGAVGDECLYKERLAYSLLRAAILKSRARCD